MEQTIFSNIINREIPAHIIYETDDVLAFLDINYVTKGHTLVIPKIQSRNIFDIDSDSWSVVMEAVRILTPIIVDAVDSEGANIIMNNESVANQAVFHSHIHIIPRHKGDRGMQWPSTKMYHGNEDKEVAEKIRSLINTSKY